MGMQERSLEEVRSFVGNGIGSLIRKAMGESVTERAFSECLSIFKSHYVRHCYDHTRLYDGVSEMLHSLKDRGVRMAIVSNKLQDGVDELRSKYFDGLVSVAIGERDGVRRKPSPDMVEMAIVALGVSRECCLYIGDSEVDVQTAKNAGIRCVSVLWGFRSFEELEKAGAATFVSEPLDLLQFF